MELVNKRYYNGFEGEHEIQFICRKEKDTDIFVIWEGYFDQIMKLISPDTQGWTGLAYYYNMYTGWYEDSPWKNINQFISQEGKDHEQKAGTADFRLLQHHRQIYP